MSELSARNLIHAAVAIFDKSDNGLAESARRAWQRGFASGGEWMRAALNVLRNERAVERGCNSTSLSIFNSLSPRQRSGERVGERGCLAKTDVDCRNKEHSSSPRPSPPFHGGEGVYSIRQEQVQDEPIERRVAFSKLGLAKYGIALGTAMLSTGLAIATKQPWWLLSAVPLFYAAEAQMVFLFPLALDGAPRLFSESRNWTRRAGGTWRVMKVVMTIAAGMILGGFVGRGFVRSWSVGCLAILIWYERLRTGTQREIRPLLEVGPALPLLTRTAPLEIFGNAQPVRLLYASDLHCNGGNSRRAIEQLIAAARTSRPDVIVLGGDLADTRGGLRLLGEAVRELSTCAPVWAIAGNHDRAPGLSEVQTTVETAGGNWLGNRSVRMASPGRKPFFLDGAIAGEAAAGRDRILCAHNPDVFPAAAARGYPLVLAGHLHGGQWVLAERGGRLFPGAWFYRWNGTHFKLGESILLVSRGVSDTLPLRWNCPREVLLCELY